MHEKGTGMTEGKKLTPVQARLERAAQSAELEEAREIVFQHGIICQVGLPRSKQEGLTFERSFKNASLLIEAGKIWNGSEWIQQPVPYGVKPRLALCHINSEAIKTQSDEIDIGGSYREFCNKLGLSTGGKSFYYLKQQMQALAACKMSFGFTQSNGIVTTLKSIEPIERFDAWLARDTKQPALWPAYLKLSQKYKESLLAHAVPMPLDAVGALSHSAMALDILAFFARRLHSLERPVRVPFVLFKEQFGQEYKDLKPFKAKFLKAVKDVQKVYPAADLQQVVGGLLLKPSRPLVNKITIQGVLPPRKTEAQIFIPQELTEQTIGAFKHFCPRLDVYACKADFDTWVLKQTPPKDYQKAFLGFAKKWGKTNG